MSVLTDRVDELVGMFRGELLSTTDEEFYRRVERVLADGRAFGAPDSKAAMSGVCLVLNLLSAMWLEREEKCG